MAVEIETGWNHDIIVCDRSAVDNYAYMVERFGRQPTYDSLVRNWLPTYDRLIWVPILTGPSFDGVRDTDRLYQQRIDETLQRLLNAFDVAPVRLHEIDRGEWVEVALRALPLKSLQLPLFGEESP